MAKHLVLFFICFSNVSTITANKTCVDMQLANGQFQPINHTSIRLWCKKGYYLRGNPTSSCVNGQWDQTETSCEKFVDVPKGWMGCGYPGYPSNGKRYIGNSDNQLRYYCNENFVRVGSEIRRCESNGVWSHPNPKCVINAAWNKTIKHQNNSFTNENDVSNCHAQYNEFYLDLGTENRFNAIQIDFNKGDSLSGHMSVTNESNFAHPQEIYSLSNQKRKKQFYIEQEVVARYLILRLLKKASICNITVYYLYEITPCGHPDIPFNGKVRKSEANVTMYECNRGYIMIGTASINCVLGVWENKIPLCVDITIFERIDCGTFKLISVIAGAFGSCIILVLSACLIGVFCKFSKNKTIIRSNSTTSSGYLMPITTSQIPAEYDNGAFVASTQLLYDNVNNLIPEISMETVESCEYAYISDY